MTTSRPPDTLADLAALIWTRYGSPVSEMVEHETAYAIHAGQEVAIRCAPGRCSDGFCLKWDLLINGKRGAWPVYEWPGRTG